MSGISDNTKNHMSSLLPSNPTPADVQSLFSSMDPAIVGSTDNAIISSIFELFQSNDDFTAWTVSCTDEFLNFLI